MQASTARDDILDHALSITPSQFEQLCRILIKRSEPTRELELTPTSGDAGIDVHAVIDRDLFQARLGLQAKRNDIGNTVSSDTMRTFKGSLSEGEYHIGTIVTTSSFSKPALESANKRYIQCIDGEQLTDIMLQSGLGVTQEDDNEFATDWDFWELFEVERGDKLVSDAIPQADDIEVLNIVLRALAEGRTVKPEIHPYMEEQTGKSWRDRQADYYAQAGFALGFVHKDTTDEYDGRDRNNWTLSSEGAEYVEYLESGRHENARELFNSQLREMEISKRILRKLEEHGELQHEELQAIVRENTLDGEQFDEGLRDGTANRRGDTLGKWLMRLPEVVWHEAPTGRSDQLKGSRYEYWTKGVTDY